FGNQAVPAGWVIVAAGNPPEYNKSVREFDLVTLDRVRRIDIEPKLSVWQRYARAQRLHPAVTAYLELRPQHFYKIENDVDGPQFVTARGWEDLSAFLQAAVRLGLPVDEGVIRSEEHTSELQSRFELVCRLPLEKKKISARSRWRWHGAGCASSASTRASPTSAAPPTKPAAAAWPGAPSTPATPSRSCLRSAALA